jgi:ceroid-lipofuscinosis protein 8
MLLKCELAHLSLWKANQFVLVHLFHCRTTLECYTYYMFLSHWDNIRDNLPVALTAMIFLQLNLNLFVLTPYWTHKKTAQMFNPADWNHPELANDSATASAKNGADHGAVGNNGFIPQQKSQTLERGPLKRRRKCK